jgi:hypothetical protein
MSTPTVESLANPTFRDAMNAILENASFVTYPRFRDFLKAPKFRHSREVSARRAAKLRKRGEYCHFLRWTVNGKCRYAWSGPSPQMFTQRLGPWQSPRYVPPQADTFRIETRYEVTKGPT